MEMFRIRDIYNRSCSLLHPIAVALRFREMEMFRLRTFKIALVRCSIHPIVVALRCDFVKWKCFDYATSKIALVRCSIQSQLYCDFVKWKCFDYATSKIALVIDSALSPPGTGCFHPIAVALLFLEMEMFRLRLINHHLALVASIQSQLHCDFVKWKCLDSALSPPGTGCFHPIAVALRFREMEMFRLRPPRLLACVPIHNAVADSFD